MFVKILLPSLQWKLKKSALLLLISKGSKQDTGNNEPISIQEFEKQLRHLPWPWGSAFAFCPGRAPQLTTLRVQMNAPSSQA